MAVDALFHYRPDDGFLHRLDIRYKIVLLLLFVPVVFSTPPVGLIVISGWTLVVALINRYQSRYTRKRELLLLFRESKILIGLTAMVFLGRTFGSGSPQWGVGVVAVWRFVLVILFSRLFTRISDPLDIQSGLYALLRFIRPITAQTIAVQIGLTVMFLPLLMDKAAEVRQACISRGMLSRKNPVSRIVAATVPLLYAAVQQAEEVSEAMTARCFSGVMPLNLEKPGRGRGFFLLSILLFIALITGSILVSR